MLTLRYIYFTLSLILKAFSLNSNLRFCPAHFSPWNVSDKHVPTHATNVDLFKRWTISVYDFEYCGTLFYGTNAQGGELERSGVLYFPEGVWTFFWRVITRAPVPEVLAFDSDRRVPQLPRT